MYYLHNYRHVGDNFLRPQSRLKKGKMNNNNIRMNSNDF